ncbi:hypothetical protein [Paenibacillus sp. S150]|uniref:hypothetical protein n=1 Tax=Paenibacillus sp. S150 TaxID=2749826 RepID=UPI0035CB001F
MGVINLRQWKKLALSLMLSVVATGGALTGQGILQPEHVSAAANAVPAYEVKFLGNPDTVLNSDGTPRSNVLETLGLASSPQAIRVEYFDTNLLELNNAGWDVRFRKKADKSDYELTYKKRYPVVNGDIQAALTLANKEGFDASDDNYEAEIDWGYSKQTLSFSNTKKVSTKTAGAVLPPEQEALELLLDKLPGKLKNWSSSNWGKQKLTASRAHGPLTFERYEGTWNGQELTLEVWPVRDGAGTGIQNIVEISFKTASISTASGVRSELMSLLKAKGWLIPEDGLKTQLILERY